MPRNTSLETQIALLVQELRDINKKLDNLNRIVVGEDGETSLVNRVKSTEHKIIKIEAFIDRFNNPKDWLNKYVTVRTAILMFFLYSFISFKESRDAILNITGEFIKALGLFI